MILCKCLRLLDAHHLDHDAIASSTLPALHTRNDCAEVQGLLFGLPLATSCFAVHQERARCTKRPHFSARQKLCAIGTAIHLELVRGVAARAIITHKCAHVATMEAILSLIADVDNLHADKAFASAERLSAFNHLDSLLSNHILRDRRRA